MTRAGSSHAIFASTVTLKDGEQVKFYAEQPTPIAVVLLGRMGHSTRGTGWNACLDEVTRLNAKS
ncbi:hypothetical protein AO240_05270 [Pseudomonas sp. ICMP 460]|nr:hypothetical protein AO240_05270 [Pseudomonas sp. ICMP 460]